MLAQSVTQSFSAFSEPFCWFSHVIVSTNIAVSSAFVMVFMFNVIFLIYISISPTSLLIIIYWLNSLNRPGDKIQHCPTTKSTANHSVVPQSPALRNLSLYVGLYLTLSNAWAFLQFIFLSTFLNAAHYNIVFVMYNAVWHFCRAPLHCPWFTYISDFVPCPML